MELKQVLYERYSARKFSPKEVPEKILQEILEAANVAPTAHNKQAFHMYVLQGDGADSFLSTITKCNYHAPLNVLVTQDTSDSWKRADSYDNGPVDIGIVGTHILLTAHDLGLVGCWIGVLDPVPIRAKLNIPDHMEPVALFEIGYPAEDTAPGPLHPKRKGVEALTTYVTID